MPHNKNITVAEIRSSEAAELAHEQAYVTMLYERLDALRAATSQRLAAVRLDRTAENDQAWSERDSLAGLYAGRGAELAAAERNLCFGRLDFDDGERLYVGRLGLRGAGHELVLVDWRAPASQPFYRATPLERYGVTRRRHLRTTGRTVVGLDDDVLDLAAVDESRLAGEAALLASLRRGRTGRMGDIVATIQADQDRIIREDLRGILVVEGGPGTGKTVVALHRAAYLLYTYRKQLARRGILVIGPNGTFMRYIDQVLPSLGENDVAFATIGSLYPGIDARAPETPRAARVKGDAKMAGVLARAVRDLQRARARTAKIAPEQLLARLYTEPWRLDLPADERAALARPASPTAWTAADVPLLDELAELLGTPGAAERAASQRRARQRAERAEVIQYATQVVADLRQAGAIAVPAYEADLVPAWIAGHTEAGPPGSLAERALADRQWAYGHVVVDEAQELSAMAWRMLIRRCPARSMTVVGDLNQASAAGSPSTWAQVLDPVAAGRWRTARLTVNYRIPKPAMALAAALLPPGAEPPVSVRDSGEAPWCARHGDDLAGLVRREAELTGAGRVAVIAPPARVAQTAAALGLDPGPDLGAPVTVLTPELAKGLEFDSVVVVDPDGIEQESPRGRADLYVALTRTTRRLGLVVTGDAPPGRAAPPHTGRVSARW